MKPMSAARRSVTVVLCLLLAGLLLCAGLSGYCRARVLEAEPVLLSAEDAPSADCIVVPATGSPTEVGPKLRARLEAAVTLYRRGASDTLVLTGRNTEPELMRGYLVGRGIPEEAMVLDASGIDFLHSMLFLASRGGDCLFCVEPLHAARAAYLAEGVGARAQFVLSGDNPPVLFQSLREYFAATKAVLQVSLGLY